MIYSVEEYYERLCPELDEAQLHTLLSKYRVTMAMILASSSSGKTNVGYSDFMAVARLAEEFGCLSIYVNVYGFPVSYVIWGNCDASAAADVPQVQFGLPTGQIYLIDFAVREGSLDQTIALWISERCEDSITVRRNDRPKQYRTYPVSRIREIAWRVCTTSDRFSNQKRLGLLEYEATIAKAIKTYTIVELALDAICRDRKIEVEITKAVPLLYDLIAVQQLHIEIQHNVCMAVLAVALTNAPDWSDRKTADILKLPFRSFLDGTDIVLIELCGEEKSLENLRAAVLSPLSAEGMSQAYLRKRRLLDSSLLSLTLKDSEIWRTEPSGMDYLIKLIRD